MDVLTVGEAFQDLVFGGLPRLPLPGEELRVPQFAAAPGGGAVITAVAAARLGTRVGALTGVSVTAAAQLRHERIKVINVQRTTERGAVSVALSQAHERSFVTFDGINSRLQPRLIRQLQSRRLRARHVHFALSPQRCGQWLPVVRWMHQRGVSTSWDFGWNEGLLADRALPDLMDAVTWLFVNEHEARLYSRKRTALAARNHWRHRSGGTVIKQGAAGALMLDRNGVIVRGAVRARVVDTTGAGDAFNGGFLAALARGASSIVALDVGAFVGARSTEALGGIDGLPHLDDLPRRWRQRLEAA